MTEPADSPVSICRRVIYSGRVQGVGFRYTTRSIARRYLVSGHVKNLTDGTVELVAQGRAEVIDDFLGEIDRRFERDIADCDVNQAPVDVSESGFAIRY